MVVGKGDLFLCQSCDTERQRLWDEEHRPKSITSSKSASTSKSTTVTPAAVGVQQQRDGAGLSASTTTQHPPVTDSCPAVGNGGQSDSPGDAHSTATPVSESKYVVNEMLAYIHFYRDRSTADALHEIAMMFYTSNETAEAKQQLISLFPVEFSDCPWKVSRRHSATRSAHDAETEDIIRMLELLDNMNVLSKVSFTACNLNTARKK